MTDNLMERIDRTLTLIEHQVTEPRATMQTKAFDRPLMETAMGESTKDFRSYLVTGDRQFIQKGLTSQSSSGTIIPPEFMERLSETIAATNAMRRVSRVTQITGDSLELIVSSGEAACGWTNESEPGDETELPPLKRLGIGLHTLYARPRVSQRLLDDQMLNIEEWVVDRIAADMGAIENKAFTLGDGTGKPKGFLNHPLSTDSSPHEGIECFGTGTEGAIIDADVLINMVTSLKPEYIHGAVWMMPRTTLAAIRQIKESTTGQYIWQPGLNTQIGDSLLGYPIVINDDMPALEPSKTSISLAFGNFYQGYQIIERGDINILHDPYSAKPYVEFYVTKRVGGMVINPEAIKLLKFGEAAE